EKTRAAYAGNGNVIVVADTSQGVHVYSYGISNDNKVLQRDMDFVGKGSDARVFVLNATLIVTAHRDELGRAVLKSWSLDPISGKISNALDTQVAVAAEEGELELSGRAGLSVRYHVVLGFRTPAGVRVLRSYDVLHNT